MAKRGRPNKWEEELMDVLVEFKDEEEETIIRVFNKVAKKTEEKVKQNAKAKGLDKTGDYIRGWTVKKGGSLMRGKYTITVCNPSKYQLTHLLEKGHISLNQYGGPYKRVRGRRHIKQAEKWGNEELIKELKAEL